MFQKIVAIEPLNITETHKRELQRYAEKVVLHKDSPTDNAEIVRRIGEADGVLVSYTTAIDRDVLDACPNIRYIGMCCSLYTPESANVDIVAAGERGIVVTGVRDYGDEGVVEYVVSELVRLLHGFGGNMWRGEPTELTGLSIGILGMGATGALVARGLRFFGAEIVYYSRTRKPALEQQEGFVYLPLDELLPRAEILCTCLNKNVVLLGEREFARLGSGKILVTTSIGPSHEVGALGEWLRDPGNYAMSDTENGLDPSGSLLVLPNVICAGKSAGMTGRARVRLGGKVIENIRRFLADGRCS